MIHLIATCATAVIVSAPFSSIDFHKSTHYPDYNQHKSHYSSNHKKHTNPSTSKKVSWQMPDYYHKDSKSNTSWDWKKDDHKKDYDKHSYKQPKHKKVVHHKKHQPKKKVVYAKKDFCKDDQKHTYTDAYDWRKEDTDKCDHDRSAKHVNVSKHNKKPQAKKVVHKPVSYEKPHYQKADYKKNDCAKDYRKSYDTFDHDQYDRESKITHHEHNDYSSKHAVTNNYDSGYDRDSHDWQQTGYSNYAHAQ
jgi:hypothetical protein